MSSTKTKFATMVFTYTSKFTYIKSISGPMPLAYITATIQHIASVQHLRAKIRLSFGGCHGHEIYWPARELNPAPLIYRSGPVRTVTVT